MGGYLFGGLGINVGGLPGHATIGEVILISILLLLIASCADQPEPSHHSTYLSETPHFHKSLRRFMYRYYAHNCPPCNIHYNSLKMQHTTPCLPSTARPTDRRRRHKSSSPLPLCIPAISRGKQRNRLSFRQPMGQGSHAHQKVNFMC